MRHVQEHVAQLNMILGQTIGWSPKWVTNAKKKADYRRLLQTGGLRPPKSLRPNFTAPSSGESRQSAGC
jgi:hypothetical protein